MITTEQHFLNTINLALSMPKKVPNPKAIYSSKIYRNAKKFMETYNSLSKVEKSRLFNGKKNVLKELDKIRQKKEDKKKILVKVVTPGGSYSRVWTIGEFKKKLHT